MYRKAIAVALGLNLIASPAAASFEGGAGKARAAEKKYCLQFDNALGSRVSRTECKTKAQWAKEGVEIDRLLKP